MVIARPAVAQTASAVATVAGTAVQGLYGLLPASPSLSIDLEQFGFNNLVVDPGDIPSGRAGSGAIEGNRGSHYQLADLMGEGWRQGQVGLAKEGNMTVPNRAETAGGIGQDEILPSKRLWSGRTE